MGSSVIMSWITQVKKYLTVGVGSAITDFTVYGLLIHFTGIPPEGANLVSRPCGGIFSFMGNKLWTFERTELAGTRRQFIRFWIVWAVSYVLSELLVWLFHVHFVRDPALPRFISSFLYHLSRTQVDMVQILPKILAEGLIATGLFLTHRFWTFRHH